MKTSSKKGKTKANNCNSWDFLRSCKVQLIFLIISIILFFVISIYMNPNIVEPVYYNPPSLVNLEGPISLNQNLAKAIILDIPIRGGESFIFHDDSIYTGTHDGKISKLFKDQNLDFARFGKPNCNKTYECGRPLGLRLSKSKKFIFALDAYFGLYKICLMSGSFEKIFPTKEFLEYPAIRYFNDLDIIDDENFIITDSSSKFPYHKTIYNFIEASSLGQVILIDFKNKRFKVLAKNLFFPNGVQITRDQKYAIISETGNNRILKLRIPKEDEFDPLEGKVDLFTPNLPGMPDNIRPSPRGGYWIALPYVSYLQNPGMLHKLAYYPTIRWLAHKILTPSLLFYFTLSQSSMIIRIDEMGKILESHQIHNSYSINVAEVLELKNGTIFLSSYYLPNLRRLNLNDL